MKKKSDKKADKRGLMALEALVGTVLSVIALFFMLDIYVSIFLVTPENMKVAQDNARSIVEFVDYSYEKYQNKNNCFTMLKLKNLENFQFREHDNSYFYIVTPEGVGIYNMKIYGRLLENPSLITNYEEFYEFKHIKNNKLMMEDLNVIEDLGSILNNIYNLGYYIFSNENNEWENTKEFFYRINLAESKMIIIKPVFDNEFLGFDLTTQLNINNKDIVINSNNQNILKALNYERVKDASWYNSLGKVVREEIFFGSHYLVFQPSEIIFPTFTLDGENYIKQNLCEIEAYKDAVFGKRFDTEQDYLDYINREDIIKIDKYDKNNNVEMSWRFSINDGEIECIDGWGGNFFSDQYLGKAEIIFDFLFGDKTYIVYYTPYGDIEKVRDENNNLIYNPFQKGNFYNSYKDYFGNNEGISNIYRIADKVQKETKGPISIDNTRIEFSNNHCLGIIENSNDKFNTCGGIVNRYTKEYILQNIFRQKLSDKKNALICENFVSNLYEKNNLTKLSEEINAFIKSKNSNSKYDIKILKEDKTRKTYLKDLLNVINIEGNEDINSWKRENIIIYDLNDFFSENYILNGCEKKICKYILYDKLNGNTYYYDYEIYNNFVVFDYSLLEKDIKETNRERHHNLNTEIELIKDKTDLYFNGHKIIFDIIKLDKEYSLGGDNYFFLIKIPVIDGSDYQIILSKTQWNKIPNKVNYEK